MKLLWSLAFCSACAGFAGGASAQNPAGAAAKFPGKPIRFVLGPSPDLLPRLVGQKLSEIWGQQVIVDPRPAANGLVAAEAVAKSTPDGYSWLLSTGTFVVDNCLNANLPYHLMRDFAPVTLMATLPFVLVVHPSVPATSVAELINVARARPGQLNYASTGNGSTAHLATEMFKNMAGVDLVHVPYKSVPAALIDVAGSQVQVMFAAAQAGLPQVRSGRLRALAVSGPKRSLAAPEIPSVAESGLPGFEVVGWNGVHVPAQTPRPLIDQLNRDIVGVLKLPDVNERMVASGFDPAATTVAGFDEFVRANYARYAKIIKDAGIRAE